MSFSSGQLGRVTEWVIARPPRGATTPEMLRVPSTAVGVIRPNDKAREPGTARARRKGRRAMATVRSPEVLLGRTSDGLEENEFFVCVCTYITILLAGYHWIFQSKHQLMEIFLERRLCLGRVIHLEKYSATMIWGPVFSPNIQCLCKPGRSQCFGLSGFQNCQKREQKKQYFERTGGVWEVYARRMEAYGKPKFFSKKDKNMTTLNPIEMKTRGSTDLLKQCPKNIRERALQKTTEISSHQTKSIALNA